MKYVNLLVGIVIFSVVATIMFGIGNSLSLSYGGSESNQFSTLSQNYSVYATEMAVTNEQSEAGLIKDATTNAEITSSGGESTSNKLVEGIKLIFNSVGVTTRIASTIEKDVGIDPIFFTAATTIIGIFLSIIIVIMLWRMKPDTD